MPRSEQTKKKNISNVNISEVQCTVQKEIFVHIYIHTYICINRLVKLSDRTYVRTYTHMKKSGNEAKHINCATKTKITSTQKQTGAKPKNKKN